MLIRCEKCSTLYELDEKLLPPQGAPVQCSKCQFVFKAYPPADAPRTPAAAANDAVAESGDGVADEAPRPVAAAPSEEPAPEPAPEPFADERAGESVPAPPPAPDVVREGGALAGAMTSRRVPGPESASAGATRPRAAGGDAPRFTADGRPIRKVPFPTSDAPPPGVRPTATRMPPARTRRTVDTTSLLRWGIVAVVLLAIAIGAAFAWRTVRARATARSRAPAGQSSGGAQGGTPAPQPRN